MKWQIELVQGARKVDVIPFPKRSWDRIDSRDNTNHGQPECDLSIPVGNQIEQPFEQFNKGRVSGYAELSIAVARSDLKS